jgi:hypothetical protein
VGTTFNQTSMPMNLKLRSTEFGTKRGEARTHSILGFVSWGDAGIAAAARQGGIRTVRHADTQFFTVLLVYQSHETVVYGD